MNPKVCNVENCVSFTSHQSTWLYSLLLAGVTSTSTLTLLSADYILERNLAQASPINLVREDLIAPEPLLVGTASSGQPNDALILQQNSEKKLKNASGTDHNFDRSERSPVHSFSSVSEAKLEERSSSDLSHSQTKIETVQNLEATEIRSNLNIDIDAAVTAPVDRQIATNLATDNSIALETAIALNHSIRAQVISQKWQSDHSEKQPLGATAALEERSVVVADTPLQTLKPFNQTTNQISVADYNFAHFKASDFHEAYLTQLGLATLIPASETAAETIENQLVAQNISEATPESTPEATPELASGSSALLGRPSIHLQGAYILQGDESSARARVTGSYVVTPYLMFGATVDLTTGNAFSDSQSNQVSLNELYFTISPPALSNLRLTAGLIDLTSYFDRNSFAKDSVTQFFNPVFQTNPALAAAGIGSRIGALVNWSVSDNLDIKAATFSSDRDLGNFSLNGFAGEVALRFGNLIVRGTYVTDKDEGQRDGFREIFQFPRDNGQEFGVVRGDREEAYGINAELFIPELKLGLFGRYGHYQNLALDRGGNTFSFGFNLLDLFWQNDRLGLGYGRDLSNDSLRQDRGDKTPDVLEAFYDVRITPNLRAGVTLQERNQFSESIAGFRIRLDFDVK